MNTGLFVGLLMLTSCATHSPEIETIASPVSVPSDFMELSGSSCVDGLFVNMLERCEYVDSEPGEYVPSIVLSCNTPLEYNGADGSYAGYTTFSFHVFDTDFPVKLIPDDVYFFCQDIVVNVGFSEPSE